MALPPKFYQFLVGVFASLGSFLYGYDLTIIAEVIGSGSFIRKFQATPSERGLVVAIFTGGAFVGAAIGGPSGDFVGRRFTIIVGAVIFVVGGALQTGAENLSYLYGGRLLAGVGVGVLTMIIPLYQAELAHPDIRGLVTGLQQFMLGIGGVCGSWISYGCYVGLSDDRQWRIPFGLQVVPAAILGILILFFPESPRWLIAKGKNEKGLQTLARLHSQGNQSDPWVVAEFEQIQDEVSFQREHEASYKQLFNNRCNLRRMILATACQAATQMTGISAIQYYSLDIFAQIGISGSNTLKYQAIGTILGLLGELMLMLLVDKIGRRWTMIGGNLAMCVCFIVSTILLAKFPPSANNSGAHWGFIVMTSWVYNLCVPSPASSALPILTTLQFAFGSTTGPLSWIIPAEIFDTATRSKGVGIAAMTSFAFNTMIGQVTSIGIVAIGWRFFIIFCVTNFTNALFFWSFLPETKKLPLEEMNRMFTEAPWFVPAMDQKKYSHRTIGERVARIGEKRGSGAGSQAEEGEKIV